ncbi:hypothetical protein EDB83DRAFT_91194 [Lactarius deliciosus]|nr:hypothetical protein EDB83DRAFT_91194 [Lactarius deliciosus]
MSWRQPKLGCAATWTSGDFAHFPSDGKHWFLVFVPLAYSPLSAEARAEGTLTCQWKHHAVCSISERSVCKLSEGYYKTVTVILYPETSAKAKRAKKTQRRYASSPVKEQCRSPVETVYSTCVHWHEHLRHPALGVLQKDMAPDGYSVDSRIWTVKPSEAGRNHSIMISCLALHWCRSGEAIREIFVGAWGSSLSEGED